MDNLKIELTEHDAWRLLLLLRVQAAQDAPVWRGYWKRLAGEVSDQLEQQAPGPLGTKKRLGKSQGAEGQ